MLKTMLAERFHLVLHTETRQVANYSLVVAKGRTEDKGCRGGRWKDIVTAGAFRSDKDHDEKICGFNRREAARPIADATGLEGVYDFTLDWPPAAGLRVYASESRAPAPVADGPSVFTALEEQLGLRLESGKGPMAVLVVDKVERTPSRI